MRENLITRNAAVWGQSERTDLAISSGVYVALDTEDVRS